MRDGYLVQNGLWRAWLRLTDAYLELRWRRRSPALLAGVSPKRVLVCVGGHLGDAVIATASIARLHQALPGVSIGILSGSWNQKVFEGHPLVRWFHAVDHWKANRSGASLASRWLRYRQTLRREIETMGAIGYEAAVDLYAYYPNFAPTLAAAKVPVRVGFVSGGKGPLYTDGLGWTPGTIFDDHVAVLRRIAPGLAQAEKPSFNLGAIEPAAVSAFEATMREHGLREGMYAVMHVGAGLRHKEWPIEHWIAVARRLSDDGVRIVLTGSGASEGARARIIRDAVPTAVDLSDRLTWGEFRCVIANAVAMLTIDTVAMHVAAAEDTPCVAVVSGVDSSGRWTAALDQRDVLTHRTPCAPCFRSRGCATMECVRGVTPDSMLNALARHVRNRAAQLAGS